MVEHKYLKPIQCRASLDLAQTAMRDACRNAQSLSSPSSAILVMMNLYITQVERKSLLLGGTSAGSR